MRKARFLAAALCAAVLLCGFTVPAYAFSDEGGGTGGSDLWEGLDPAETAPAPSPEPEQKPFTPSGTGTVVDNATDQEGKEFFTITTADESVFYLVIDRQRGAENVYFLNAVTLADLAALAEANGEPPRPRRIAPTNPPLMRRTMRTARPGTRTVTGSRRNEPGTDPRGKGGHPQAGALPMRQL